MKSLTERLVSFIDKQIPNNNLKKEYFNDISSLLDDLSKKKIPFSIEGSVKVFGEHDGYALVNFEFSRKIGRPNINIGTTIIRRPFSLPDYDLVFFVSFFLVKEQNLYFMDDLLSIEENHPYLDIEEVKFSDPYIAYLYSMATYYKSEKIYRKFS